MQVAIRIFRFLCWFWSLATKFRLEDGCSLRCITILLVPLNLQVFSAAIIRDKKRRHVVKAVEGGLNGLGTANYRGSLRRRGPSINLDLKIRPPWNIAALVWADMDGNAI